MSWMVVWEGFRGLMRKRKIGWWIFNWKNIKNTIPNYRNGNNNVENNYNTINTTIQKKTQSNNYNIPSQNQRKQPNNKFHNNIQIL
jgi:hypothetical protein